MIQRDTEPLEGTIRDDVFVTLGLPLIPQASVEKPVAPLVYFPITGNSPPLQPQS